MTPDSKHEEILEAIEAVKEEHGQIVESIDSLNKDLEVHVAEGHAVYVHRTEIEGMLADFTETVKEWLAESRADRKRLHATVGELNAKSDAMSGQQEILAEVVLGKPERDIDNQIVRTGGMAEIVADYTNGGKGFKTQLPDYFWTKLILTLVSVGGMIAAAIIQAAPGGG